jgi:hypothetical protein
MTERITPGVSHPNRPLPSHEVFVTADEVLVEHAPFLVEAAQQGVQDVADLLQSPLRVSQIGDKWADGEYGSTDWFTARAYIRDESGQHEGQLLWNALHRDLEADPNRETAPHLGYMLVGRDMTALGPDNKVLNFIFGATDKEIGQTVQSVYRFLEAGLSSEQVALVTKHIARHEFGHLVGLDSDSIRNQDKRGGIYEGHCANECTMQQVMSVPEAIGLATRLKDKPKAGFCNDCTGFLARH